VTNVKLLTGLKVVDFGVGMAAAIAAKLLADSGAEVLRVEPEGGDPFAAMIPAYAVLRRGAKPGRETDLADADICIIGGDDHPELTRRSDAADLSARFPRLVVLDINDGPAGTHYTGPSTELLAQVRSGLAFEQMPDRPVVNAFEPATYGAALQGVCGILAALIAREASGRGQVVTTSLFEGALIWIGSYWAQLEKPTPMANFVIPRGVCPLIFKAKDGVFLHLAIGGAGSKYGFYQALEIDDPSVKPSDSGMPAPGAGPREFFGDCDLLAAHVAKKDSADLLARIWELGLPAEPVQQPGVCWDEAQIVRNGIIKTDADGTRHVGLPFIAEPLGAGAGKKIKAGRGPLSGLRVIDCGAFVAGPLAAVALADLGADVIKIEAKQGDPNRSIFRSFTVANRSKKVIGVDMKAPEGLAIVQALCRDADIVMNNFRPGVSARLGVDPKSVAKLNPDVIVLEAPAYGSEGPLAFKAGFDMVMQAWVGHEAKAAGRGNDPRWNRTNLVDIAAAQLGTVAMLSALLHRERTGESVALESPLCNAGIFTLSELIQNKDGRFAGVPQLSSSLSGYHPAECLYQAQDSWIAIVARGEKAALALREALGVALAGDAASWGEAEESLIAEKIATLDAAAVQALLAPHQIWVEICHDDCEKTILNDPALIAYGTVRTSSHASFGQINELGTMFHLSASDTGNDLAAPLPGQQTREILEQLGYDAARIDDLYTKGVVV
jgi:crotonobetainyl-CoA:carnitine CoA-transferase CaiB-like acyl-CoA transferase